MKYLFTILLLPLFTTAQVKVPIVKVINPTMTGATHSLFDEQSSNVQVSGSSNQSIKPANSNSWWDSPAIFDANTCLITQWNSYTGRYRIKALPPEGITYEFKFNGNYNITKICIFTQLANSGKSVVIKSGTPFNYSNLVDSITTFTNGAWNDYTTNFDSRWVQLTVSEDFGYLNEIVFYGTLIGSEDSPEEIIKVMPKRPLDSIMATNVFYNMGRSADGNYYNTHWTGGLRYFAAAAYLQYADGSLKFGAGTADTLEYLSTKMLKDSGSNVHFVLGSLVDSGMVGSLNNSGGDWADQKPIPTSLGNESTGQSFNYGSQDVSTGAGSGYILTFNEIAENPASYARAASSLRKYAKGNKKYLNIGFIEPDNEKDGTFKKAGFMYPYQIAAMVSTYYDGNEGTVTYSGDSVGVWGTGVKLIFPALSYTYPDYIEAMTHWWRYNRSGVGGANKVYPFDVFNVHQYPGTLEVQFSGTGKAVSPERTDVYNLKAKLDTALYFSAIYGTPLVNTEIGFDAYIDTNKRNNSFQAIHAFGTKNVEQIQADWTIRSYLLHAAKGVTMYQYWLADQGNYETTSGTFNATGYLKWNTEGGGLAYLQKRPSYYFYKTIKNRLGNYRFVSEEIIQDTLYKQLYQSVADTTQKAYVIWLGTENESSKSTATYLGTIASSSLVQFDLTETGNETNLGVNNPTITATETPQIIMFKIESDVPPAPAPCQIYRTSKKFINL